MGLELWLKALHIIAVISWMAGLLYLPRLFIYHTDADPASPMAKTFTIMERRLLKAIMTPAMITTWALGLWLAYEQSMFTDTWFHVKLALVVALTIFHVMLAKWRNEFEAGRNTNSTRFYRIANEIPTMLMIVIVFLVVMKPFA